MSHEGRIRIAAICGSVRPGNYTRKALGLTLDELGKDPDVAVDAIYPEEFDLPLPGLPATGNGPERLRKIVDGATGVVMATPEYHGSFSSVTKLVIENLGFPSVLSGKPVVLLGVAAGAIGAIKSLEQLRGVCAHVGAIALPLPVSIAGVQKAFDEEGNCLDEQVERRVRGVATHLLDYIRRNVCPRIQLERIVREGAA
jgi:NAD(P)H-dependent FMN reductase